MDVTLLVRRFPAVSETFVVNEARWLLDRGHAVHLVPERPTGLDAGVPADVLARLVSEPQLRPLSSRGLPRMAREVGNAWLRNRPSFRQVVEPGSDRKAALLTLFWLERLRRLPETDAVHAHFGPTALFAARCREAGVLSAPFVATFHGQDVTALPHRRHDLAMYQPVFDQASAMTVGSAFMKGKLTDLGAPAHRVFVLPQPVDSTAFSPSAKPRDSAGVVVLTVGRLAEVKGLRHGLTAFARASRQVDGLRYVIVGDGPLRTDLEALARELGVTEKVEFRGALDHASVAAAYRDADVVMLSGIRTSDGQEEGQGLAPLEAAASGLPVIASRSGGLAETVADQSTGLLVPPGDEDALCHALLELVNDADRRGAMGAVGRERAVQHYSVDAHMTRLMELMDTAVSGRQSSAEVTT